MPAASFTRAERPIGRAVACRPLRQRAATTRSCTPVAAALTRDRFSGDETSAAPRIRRRTTSCGPCAGVSCFRGLRFAADVMAGSRSDRRCGSWRMRASGCGHGSRAAGWRERLGRGRLRLRVVDCLPGGSVGSPAATRSFPVVAADLRCTRQTRSPWHRGEMAPLILERKRCSSPTGGS